MDVKEITEVHCLFEQSGTFKKAFTDYGLDAFDYDIRNDYEQTDFRVDLFREIDKCYQGDCNTIFRRMQSDCLVMAFFPCIYFCENNQMMFTGTHANMQRLSPAQKIETILQRSTERERYYSLLLKLFAIAERQQFKMIVENPFTAGHYLKNNFPYKPAVIDWNRRRRGDYFSKPTQYWFVGCTPGRGETYVTPPAQKFVERIPGMNGGGICNKERSIISPIYADVFIADFIFECEAHYQGARQLTLTI